MASDAAREAPDAVPTVTVRGEAVLRAEPDEATLWVTLTALEQAPRLALEDVAHRSAALLELLDELDIPQLDRSTTGVGVSEEFEHTQRGRRSLGHRAVARVAIRLVDSDVIGRLVTRATAELDAHIDGPRWQIAQENPVRLEAARMAAADARRKARAYAEGVGARLGPLMRLAEPEHGHSIRAGLLRPLAASAEAPLPIEPGEQHVGAAIDATFTLEVA